MPKKPTKPDTASVTTEQFAKLNGIKGTSLRGRLYLTGSYFGIVPTRCPNGRLLWPNPASAEAAK